MKATTRHKRGKGVQQRLAARIVSSHDQGVLSTLSLECVYRLAPCTKEQADTRMFFHVADAIKSGFFRIVVRSVDTDILVLAVALVQKLQEQTQESIQLWVAFGTVTNLSYVPAHEIPSFLGLVLAVALMQKLQEQTQESIQLWVAFGTVTNLPYVPAHEIPSSLGENNALALPTFHTFSGCDTVSCFFGKSKRTEFET